MSFSAAVAFDEIIRQLALINRRLSRIEYKEGVIMSELDDQLLAVLSAVDEVDADVARELQDFATAIGGKLTADQQAKFAAIVTKLANVKLAVDVADPPPAA